MSSRELLGLLQPFAWRGHPADRSSLIISNKSESAYLGRNILMDFRRLRRQKKDKSVVKRDQNRRDRDGSSKGKRESEM